MILDTIIRGFENRIWIPKNLSTKLRFERNSKVRILMLDVPNAEVMVMSNKNTPLIAIRQELILLLDAMELKLKNMDMMRAMNNSPDSVTDEEWMLMKERKRPTYQVKNENQN